MNAPNCEQCGHKHLGPELGYICVGCTCEWRPDGRDPGPRPVTVVELFKERDSLRAKLAAAEKELDELRAHAECLEMVEPPVGSLIIPPGFAGFPEVQAAVLAEREECAQIADAVERQNHFGVARNVAAEIRARTTK